MTPSDIELELALMNQLAKQIAALPQRRENENRAVGSLV
jgi:hypothetical protein